MTLQAGKPSNKSQKELAIESVQEIAEHQEKEKTQRFNVDIPVSLHRDIKIQAVKEGITLNVLAARLFNDYLSKVSNN
ncbi:MAG: toxin-antitoxin system HicB family antitoxin [Methylococcaceae bacterium]